MRIGAAMIVLAACGGAVRPHTPSPHARAPRAQPELSAARAPADDGPVLVPQAGHAGQIWAVAWSPDGRFLATGGFDHTVRLWDEHGRLWAIFVGHHEAIRGLAFSPDGEKLASASRDGTIRVHDLRAGGSPIVLEPAGWNVAWSADGRSVVSGGLDTHLRVWDASTGVLTADRAPAFSTTVSQFLSIAVSPDGRTVATGSNNGALVLWDTAAWTVRAESGTAGPSYWNMAYTPDGSAIIASDGAQFYVFDAANAQLSRVFSSPGARPSSFAISPDGLTIASGGRSREAALWDLASGTIRARARFTRQPEALAFRSTDSLLALAIVDSNRIRLWDPQTRREVRAFGDAFAESSTASPSPDGAWLATAGDASAQIWDRRSGEVRFGFQGEAYSMSGLAWSPDSKYLAIGGEEDDAFVVALPAGNIAARLRVGNPQNSVWTFLWLDDGRLLVSCAGRGFVWAPGQRQPRPQRGLETPPIAAIAGTAEILVADSDAIERRVLGQTQSVVRWTPALARGLQFQGVGVHEASDRLVTFVSGLRENHVVVWQLSTGAIVADLPRFAWHASPAFSPDGASIAFPGPEHTVRVWSGADVRDIARHDEDVRTIVWSSDGRWIASGGDDGQVLVTDVRGGTIARRSGHEQRVWSVAFTPGDRAIVSASSDARILRLADGLERTLRAFRDANGQWHGLTIGSDGLITGTTDALTRIYLRSGPGVLDATLDPLPPSRIRAAGDAALFPL